jgi:hypothetical protein
MLPLQKSQQTNHLRVCCEIFTSTTYELWVNQLHFCDHPHDDPNGDVVPDMVVRTINPLLPFQFNLEGTSNFNQFKMLVNHQLGCGDHDPGIPIGIVVSNTDEDFKI